MSEHCKPVVTILSLVMIASTVSAADLQLDGARVEIYKTVGDVELPLHIFTPPMHQASDKRTAVVFFFGGGWRAGTPKQFEQHCRYLASRGMVAMTADYRVASRHGVKAVACVEDAKSAVRWIRQNATRLGIDPQRIAAGGGSAGGHLAACTGVLREFDAAGEDPNISSQPNALILFNPAVVLAAVEGQLPLRNAERLADRMGVEPERLSPYHHVGPKLPPALIFHGRGDDIVPYRSVEWFAEAMRAAGNRCELVGYDGQGHGFFNYGRNGNKFFIDTVTRTDRFLTELGYLEGEPRVEAFLKP